MLQGIARSRLAASALQELILVEVTLGGAGLIAMKPGAESCYLGGYPNGEEAVSKTAAACPFRVRPSGPPPDFLGRYPNGEEPVWKAGAGKTVARSIRVPTAGRDRLLG